MITENEFINAQETIRKYGEQQTHQVRISVLEDCPTKDFEEGKPSGNCETDGHYMCFECKHCDNDFTPITIDEANEGFDFLNYSDEEEAWNEVRIVQVNDNSIDITNVEESSDFYLDVWTITEGEFTNINNSKKIKYRD